MTDRVALRAGVPPFYVMDVWLAAAERQRTHGDCSKLLADTGVAIAPGIDFDTARGGSFVRISFAGPSGDIEEALRRIGSWLPSQ